MIYSLNEIDAHCKKAARGAGFEWGYAEEIGKAARWLAAFDLPGIAVLAAYLKERDEHPELFCRPDVSNMAHIISRNSGSLCPVLTGAWLCDSAGTDTQASMQFELLYYPLLLVPFLAQIAGSIQQTLTFEYRSTRLQYSDGVLNLDNDADLGCRLWGGYRISWRSSRSRLA